MDSRGTLPACFPQLTDEFVRENIKSADGLADAKEKLFEAQQLRTTEVRAACRDVIKHVQTRGMCRACMLLQSQPEAAQGMNSTRTQARCSVPDVAESTF